MQYSVPNEVNNAWFFHEPIDIEGRPSTKFSARLLQYFLDHKNIFHYTEDVAVELNAHPELVRKICRFLDHADYLVRDQNNLDSYKYNLNPFHVEKQANMEGALLPPITWTDRIAETQLPEFPPEMRLPPRDFLLARMS